MSAGTLRPADARVGPLLRDTIRRFRTAGIATARPDAELLLAHVLETSRLALHVEPRRELDTRTVSRLATLIERRLGHEPLQYLLGAVEFCRLRIAVGPGVFIPRPETELLAEQALAVCPERGVVVELCAGSAAVACALAAARPAIRVWAVELSPDAATWARRNVQCLGFADRVAVVEGDLFEPLVERGLTGACDLLVANPPYIARPALDQLPVEVRRHEPAVALDGGEGGLDVITRILADATDFLGPGSPLLLEIGHDHGENLRARLAADPRYQPPTFRRDLFGYDRVVEVRRR